MSLFPVHDCYTLRTIAVWAVQTLLSSVRDSASACCDKVVFGHGDEIK